VAGFELIGDIAAQMVATGTTIPLPLVSVSAFTQLGLVQKRSIGGNSSKRVGMPSLGDGSNRRGQRRNCFGSIALEALKAEKLQPMRMPLAVQQFGRTFADSFGSFAAHEAAMVQKQTQQVQIVVADVAA
jgi:hypothetical protein